jgi:hypothetical protein
MSSSDKEPQRPGFLKNAGSSTNQIEGEPKCRRCSILSVLAPSPRQIAS